MTNGFSYSEIESVKAWNDKAFLSNFQVDDKGSLSNFLDSTLDIALAKKNQIQTEKNSSSIVSILQNIGMPLPQPSSKLDSQEVTGLIGEIISEEFLKGTKIGNSFYVKWRENGTSKSKGIDIIFQQTDMLFIDESKHSHEQLKNGSNSETSLIATIQKAFNGNSEYHTIINLARLYLRTSKAMSLLVASGSNVDEIKQKIQTIRSTIQNYSFSTNATLVVDEKFLNGLKLNDFSKKINFNTFPLFQKLISTFLIGMKDLQKITDLKISKYGK